MSTPSKILPFKARLVTGFYLIVAAILILTFCRSGRMGQGLILGALPIIGLGRYLYADKFHSRPWRNQSIGQRALWGAAVSCLLIATVLFIAGIGV